MTTSPIVLNIDIKFGPRSPRGYYSHSVVDFPATDSSPPSITPNTIYPNAVAPPNIAPQIPSFTELRQRGVSTYRLKSNLFFDGTAVSNKTFADSIDFSFKPKETVGENLNIYAGGFESSKFSAQSTVWNFHTFVDPIGFLNTVSYGKPVIQNLTRTLKPGGWQSSSVGKPLRLINKNVKIAPKSIDAQSFGRNLINNLTTIVEAKGFQSSSVPKPASVINANRKLYPSAIQSLEVGKPEQVLNLSKEIQPTGYTATSYGWHSIENSTSIIGVAGFQYSVVSTPLSVTNFYKTLKPSSFLSFNAGLPGIHNLTTIVNPKGWQSSAVGRPPSVVSYFKDIYPPSIDSNLYGKPLVYNLTQYRTMRGFDASEYGRPYLMGGVKWLSPRGYDASDFGKTQAINTTADQTAKPAGINSLAISAPIVSPRILYPSGFYNNGVYTNGKYETIKFGTPDVRDPAIKPIGELHTSYGVPTVWFHTRPLSPNGILSYQSGYPRVADPTQFAYPPSLLTSAIFGDTAIRNLSFKVSVPTIFDGGFSDYTTLTNSNRYYKPSGINSLEIGAASIINKTPSIFVDGIKPYDVGTPAIGHAIRFVQPTGFDHLLFGRAVLTKTPEIFPRSHESSAIGQSWISHKNRTIDLIQKGINSFKSDEPTVWYGQRPIKTKGWQTASYGGPTLTHEVREVLGQGFKRDAYGIPWVSFGTRSIEPTGIYKDFPSNHMVGGTQTIKPAGYEATLWGERIIPISQSIQPLGFRESWGNTTIDLHTKYVAPVGYISVGQQPADRWGDITVYNKLQYIVQEFDVNSGLVPPKWSEWTAIANRNIQMNVTGFASQRFGYSQIDNNAAPLLPNGIEPPAITIGMISHGVRAVTPEAIEAPHISTWGVVHNGARVIAPLGHAHTQWGNDGTVVNTRREYRNVGRIDSLETGTPMIAYRIRTIDIEPRYSIAPPQINLPTIDLYTRYVGFNGYETTKYGLPSLSIHFNIIGPSWRHRDDFGESVVRNVTPELLAGAFDSQEFGRASIRTQWRHVQAQGDTATLFGSAMIADTKQQIGLRGWQDSITSQLHTVTKTGAPPYTTQNIWLQNESKPWLDGFGIKPTSKPSEPGLNQNVIYHRGHNSQKFGDTFVWSNNLYVDYGIYIKNFGAGTSIKNQNRFIDVAGMDYSITVSKDLGVTPFYVKPRSFNQPYDAWTFNSDDKFGRTKVTNQHRAIYPRGHSSSNVGYGGRVSLHTRYVEPPTIRGFAMGFPEIPFTPKTIDVTDYGFDSSRYGSATVERPPYTGPQDIKGRGFNSLSISSNHRVELLHRELLAVGSNHLRMGRSISNDTPYMWQGLRVGEFVPMCIGAGDTSVFGDTRIGLRVREIPVEGFVAFRSEYEPARFKDRMKVIGLLTNNPLTQGVTAGGISSEEMGSVGIKLGQHFITPDGNADQFRKSGYSAEFGAPTISG